MQRLRQRGSGTVRVSNGTPDLRKKNHCGKCDNTGFVLLQEEYVTHGLRYGNLTAPCPGCDYGNRIEFSDTGKERWGEDGFWANRNDTYLHMVTR